METEFYSSLDWALGTGSRESAFPWETSPSSTRPVEASSWTDPQLDLLLSASSYPVPQPLQSQGQEEIGNTGSIPLYAGLIVNYDDLASASPSAQRGDRATAGPAPDPTKHRSSKTTGEAVRKRGRPRKLFEGPGDVSPEERRRMQVRMAQRAYRSRKEAGVTSLKDRINQLETAMKQMSTAVISFGDELVRSGALDTHPDLLKPLGNTVQACLTLPMIFTHGYADGSLGLSGAASGGKKQMLTMYPSPSSSSSETGDTMEIPEFIDRLHITCCYQAYLVCANPAVPMRRIERPFRMLLSLMPRPIVAEYFKDWLLARAGHKTLDHWDHIPFFRIGGAGTHYSTSAVTRTLLDPHRTKRRVEDDFSQFPLDIQRDLDDEWFDMGDLEGYFREKQIIFPAPALTVPGREYNATSVSRLIQSLVRGATCLGRSPGFRRRDVEKALDEFQASLNVTSS